MFDEKTLKELLLKKQREREEAEEQAYRAKSDQAALERVLEMMTEAGGQEEAASQAASPPKPSETRAQKAQPAERPSLYGRGGRPKRVGPPREGSIADQSITILKTFGTSMHLDDICDQLSAIRKEEVNSLSVDRILRREVKEGTLKLRGDKHFALAEWPDPPSSSHQPEELQLN